MDFTVLPVLGILFPVMIIALVFFFVIILRIFSHRERMAMIAKGIAPPGEEAAERTPQSQLRRALTSTLVGVALLLGLLTLGIGPWLLGGLIPMFIGIAYLISYFAATDREKQ